MRGRDVVSLGFKKFAPWVVLWVVALGASPAQAQRVVIFSEDFEGLRDSLGPNADEEAPQQPILDAFTKTPPTGWSINNQLPTGGRTEWRGWSFANPAFWSTIGGEGRAAFAFGTGNVIAVADSGEWADQTHGAGTYNTFLRTPSIPLTGVPAGALELGFDSSWRARGDQTAILTASYDGGTPIEVFRWESDVLGFNFKPDANPEVVGVNLANPANASNVVLTFAYTNAVDDYWWAVDNIRVLNGQEPIFSENFEGMTLGPPVDEPVFTGNPSKLWTAAGPDGWNVDRSGVPGAGNDDLDGVTEWAGWSFVDKSWWLQISGDQGRASWSKGSGIVAVADPNEWSDQPHSPSAPAGWYKTGIETPPIDVSMMREGTVELKFDSSWRPEFDSDFHQAGKVMVSFDGGSPVEVLRFESVNQGGHKTQITDASGQQTLTTNDTDLINTTQTIQIDNPANAQMMTVEFYMYDAGNDWWWAVDNIVVSGEEGTGVIFACGDIDRDSDVDISDMIDLMGNWTGAGATGAEFEHGDCDADGDVDIADLSEFFFNWTGALAELEPGVVGPAPMLREGVAAVPEPGTVTLLLVGLALGVLGRRRA